MFPSPDLAPCAAHASLARQLPRGRRDRWQRVARQSQSRGAEVEDIRVPLATLSAMLTSLVAKATAGFETPRRARCGTRFAASRLEVGDARRTAAAAASALLRNGFGQGERNEGNTTLAGSRDHRRLGRCRARHRRGVCEGRCTHRLTGARSRRSRGGARRSRGGRGRALVIPTDVSTGRSSRCGGERRGARAWANRRLGQQRDDVGVFALQGHGTAEFRRVTEVTYLGFVYGTLAALRSMLARDRGIIVQVGSALAYRSIRCRRRIAAPSMRSRLYRLAALRAGCTTRATYASRWCTCRR